jgi:chromosome segregation ATPase
MRLILISLVLVLFVFKAHSTPESQHKLEAINTQYSSLKQRIESLERQDLLKESKYENLHTKLTELKIVTGHLHLEKGNSEYSKAALNQLRLELSGLNNRLDILRDKAVNVGNDSSGIGIA